MIKVNMQKLTTRLFFVILFSAVISVSLFIFLWSNSVNVIEALKKHQIVKNDYTSFMEYFKQEVKDIDLKLEDPDSGELELNKKLMKIIKKRDKYTGVEFLTVEKPHRYLGGFYGAIMNETLPFYLVYLSGYEGELSKTVHKEVVSFKNQNVLIHITSYQHVALLVPYLMFSIIVSVLLFLTPVLYFVKNRMRYVNQVKEGILKMAEGDLQHEIIVKGKDELGVLAQQLDLLRITLDENITQEKLSRQANHDLISAMSHDLKTPLTTLSGYLEILKMDQIDDAQKIVFLDRCIQKTQDIKELSDKMFEYALVFEQVDDAPLIVMDVTYLCDMLHECIEYLEMNDIEVNKQMVVESRMFKGNEGLLKRMLNNLFSNILKYADRKEEVCVALRVDNKHIILHVHNVISHDEEPQERNGIGLKSVRKIVELHNGTIDFKESETSFDVLIQIPIYTDDDNFKQGLDIIV